MSAIFQKVIGDEFCSSYRGYGKVIYWSVDLETAGIWEPLAKARRALGEVRGYSEPDIIVICENAILILEIKFTSAAVTRGTRLPGYYAEQPRWDQVFKLSPQDVLDRCGYELLRYFLLAHELESITGRHCRVVSLTMQDAEPQLHNAVTQSLLSPYSYAHINWDSVAAAIPAGSIRTKFIKRYLASKSAGYDNGVLVKLLK